MLHSQSLAMFLPYMELVFPFMDSLHHNGHSDHKWIGQNQKVELVDDRMFHLEKIFKCVWIKTPK